MRGPSLSARCGAPPLHSCYGRQQQRSRPAEVAGGCRGECGAPWWERRRPRSPLPPNSARPHCLQMRGGEGEWLTEGGGPAGEEA